MTEIKLGIENCSFSGVTDVNGWGSPVSVKGHTLLARCPNGHGCDLTIRKGRMEGDSLVVECTCNICGADMETDVRAGASGAVHFG